MYFSDIIGQSTAKEELIKSFKKGILPHARLFVGEDGSGALALAYAYARYINCLSPRAHDSCGTCRSCLRYNNFATQDLHYIFPIVNDSSRNYCDDYLVEWRDFLSSSPYNKYSEWMETFGGANKSASIFVRENERLLEKLSYHIDEDKYRVILLWLPEKLEPSLANKLLKLTEEPPQDTVLLMVSQNKSEILGTLLSRLQTIHLQKLSEEEILSGLQDLGSKEAKGLSLEESAHLAQGNFRQAQEIYQYGLQTEEVNLDLLKRFLRCSVNAQPAEMKALSDGLAAYSKDIQISFLKYLAQIIREAFIFNYEVEQLNYLDQQNKALVSYLKGCFESSNSLYLQQEIEEAILHLERNVNARMVFFDLLLRFTAKMAANYKEKGIR